MNDLEIGQNIANVNNLEKEQNKFLEQGSDENVERFGTDSR